MDPAPAIIPMAFIRRLGLALALAMALLPGLVGSGGTTAAPAPTDAESSASLIAYRRRSMAALSAHYRALEEIIVNQVPVADQALSHANALKSLAPHIPAIFPAGSSQLDSEGYGAKPSIWTEPEAFAAIVNTFEQDLQALTVTLQRQRPREEQASALAKVRQSCLNCHSQFRVRRS